MPTSEERMARLVAQLEQNPGLAGQLPGAEGAIVPEHGISTEVAWSALSNAARRAGG